MANDDTKWEITYLKVETSQSDSKTDTLFANGRMQVPVIVRVKAKKNAKSTEVYTLTAAELSTIELIHYDDPDKTLSDGWSYSDKKNELFANTISTARSATLRAAVAQTLAASTDVPQTKKYMVSTTKVESMKVGARIQQPTGTTVSTAGTKFNAHVTLTGKPPVVYTTDNVSVSKENTKNGEYQYDWWDKDTKRSSLKPFHQDNYFVSSNGYNFVKADIYGFDTTGKASGHPSDERLKNCYSYWSAPGYKTLKLCFIWEYGSEATRTAGLLRKDGWDTSGWRKAWAWDDIKINQKSNALCLTRMAFECPDSIWGKDWCSSDCGFTLYDIYGNTGKFHSSFSDDHDQIVIRNAN